MLSYVLLCCSLSISQSQLMSPFAVATYEIHSIGISFLGIKVDAWTTKIDQNEG